MIDLCTLGTGGSIPLHTRALASLYIRVGGRALLLDCGEGTQIEIGRLGWGFLKIEGLLLTHYHADHCSGLPGFLLALAKAGRTEDFEIWGPPGLARVVNGLRVIAPQLPFALRLRELPAEGGRFSAAGLDITAFPLDHGIPCLGYVFDLSRPRLFLPEKAAALNVPVQAWKTLQAGGAVRLPDGRDILPEAVLGGPRPGLRFLYATDTRPVPAIGTLGRDCDLMILEGMYGPEDKLPLALKNRHMLYRESAALARAAGARRLLLTHFSTATEDPEACLPLAQEIFPDTACARDGMVLTLRWRDTLS